ncbi:hypothetical protein COB64_02105 [Candidatus Wolfebacteria bacterium]|nr:MAG: hypothetical protein COB64_02105 [Candidatus Wolfebacteria bacterium]
MNGEEEKKTNLDETKSRLESLDTLASVGVSKEDQKETPKASHTLASDTAHVLQEGGSKGAFIKKTIQNERRKEKEVAARSLTSKKNKFFLIGGTVFSVVAIIIIFVFIVPKKMTTVLPQLFFPTLLFSEQHKQIDITKTSPHKLIGTIRSEVKNAKLGVGDIKNIIFTQADDSGRRLVGVQEFLTSIEASIPSFLLSSLTEFMVGTYSSGINQPFIILRSSSPFRVYEGMSEWEDKLFTDFHQIFDLPTSGENKALFDKDFEEALIDNNNARVLRDSTGTIVLLYTFVDDTTIVISRNELLLGDVLDRLRIQSLTQ